MNQRHGNRIGGIRQAWDLALANAGEHAGALTGARIDAQAIADLGAVAVQIQQHVQVLLDRRGRECAAVRVAALGEAQLKALQVGRLELGEAPDMVFVHPTDQHA